LTLWAVAEATKAKEAAKQARKAVFHRNAADSFTEILRFAEQFATWVECERRAEAVVQIREIVLRLARDRGEFDRFLGSDGDKLVEVESNCKIMADFLSRGEFPFGAAAKRDLFNETLRIVRDLSEVLGRLRGRMEMGEL
jgi:hypothetical protein